MNEHQTDHDLLVSLHTQFIDVKKYIESSPKMFVSRDEFKPVRMIVYGAVAIILTAVATTGIYAIIKSNVGNVHAQISTIQK